MNTESGLVRWLRRLVYCSAIVPLIIVSQYVSPFHFGKVVILRSIVEVMAVLYVLLVMRDKSYLPKSNPITWAFLAFTLAFTLATFTSAAFLQSFWGSLERMGGLFTFWHYFVFYIITVSVLRTKQDWQVLIDLIVSVGFVSALYGFLQRFSLDFILGSGGRERIFGTIGNPALFAGYQILVAYLAATLFFTRRIGPMAGVPVGSAGRGMKYIAYGLGVTILLGLLSSPINWLSGLWVAPLGLAVYGIYLFCAESFGWGRIMYGIGAALMLLAAALTVVRGSLVAMVVETIVFVLLYSILYRSRVARNILLGGVAAVIIFVFLGVVLRNTPLVQNSPYFRRVTDFSPQTFTVQTRLWAWSAGFQGWHDNAKTVLVGWGPESFNIPFSKYFNPQFFTGPGAETLFDRAHNMFVEILVTMGLAGEITYLAIFGTLFWTLARFMKREGDERILGIGLTSLTIAYIIHNCFIFDTSANFLTFFMILAFVTHVSLRGPEGDPVAAAQKGKVTARPWTAAQMTVALVMGVAATVLIYSINIKSTMANYASTRAIVAGSQGDFAGAVQKYIEAIDANVPGRYEYRNNFAEYLVQVAAANDPSKIPQFQQIALRDVEFIKQSIQENPHDYLPYLYISKLYLILGNPDPASPYNQMALDYSNQALAISPTFVRTYYEVAQAYLNMNQLDKAFDAFSEAQKLNPDVGITYWYMAVVDFKRNKTDEGLALASKALANGYELSEADAQKVVGGFVQANDWPDVVIVYQQLTLASASNSQYWASLAAAYVKVNRISDAVNAVHKAMALNPNDTDFQQQGHEFLHQLGAE